MMFIQRDKKKKNTKKKQTKQTSRTNVQWTQPHNRKVQLFVLPNP